jgi:hypothetical protein
MTQANWSKKQQLWIRAYLQQPVFHDRVLRTFHQAIDRYLPQWSADLKVAKNPDSKNVGSLGRERDLSQAIQQAAPPRRGLGSAVLKGAYKGLVFYLDSCEKTLPPELNYISIEVHRVMTVDDVPPPEWARSFFEWIVSALPVRYGNVSLSEEFDAKNLIDDAEGLHAVGVKLDVSLPGLYWLNYFGAPYVRLIGEESLLSSPAYETKKVGAGVLIALDFSPLNWESASYQEREEQTINHLGRRFFFLKGEPSRQLIAPDFRAE